MRRKNRTWVWVVVALAVVGGAVGYWQWNKTKGLLDQLYDSNATGAPPAKFQPVQVPQRVEPPVPLPASAPATLPFAGRPATMPATTSAPSSGEALAAYQGGLAAISASRLIDARTELSKAYFSGLLPPDLQAQVRAHLKDLFEKTILAPAVLDGDSYAFTYTLRPGETLEGKAPKGIEQTLQLHVPAKFLLHLNGLNRGEDIRSGQTVKLIRGPFHAIVYKSAFAMDLYLQREGLEKVFAMRLPVGLGKNGSTPLGDWKVRRGGKTVRLPWYPPPSSGLTGPIGADDPRYAFGPKGLWIGLEGTDPRTVLLPQDYGIHSTNDPNTIGTNSSLGCIRLRDDDIDMVYSMLYDEWSTVQIVP